MKKILAFLLSSLMLLASCTPAIDNNTGDDTDNPDDSTASPKVERIDYSIDVKEDTYVMNKNGSNDLSDTNFGTDTEIHLKTNGSNLTRYGYLKFDISSLVGDDDFTAIELDLFLTTRQNDEGAPLAAVEVYGADIDWDETSATFNKQPEVFNLITKKDDIGTAPSSCSFSVTDYVRQALANGQTEIALCLKEATPNVPLHTRFASKENGSNTPQLSVYYGTKVDNAKYEGETQTKGIEISENGLDKLLGWHEVDEQTIVVKEDTFVEGGSASKNFGSSDVIESKGAASIGTHRIFLLKFDISQLKDDEIVLVQLVFNVFEMEKSSTARQLNFYACDPYEWEENSVTYQNVCSHEELITSQSISGTGLKYIDLTEYIKKAKANGDKLIALYVDGEASASYRTRIDSKEKVGGTAPCLNVYYSSTIFTTKINYVGENPWDVAMTSVNTWLNRWEEIKKHGRTDAELIVKDADEYSVSVDAATATKTDGANTVYTAQATRTVSTLKGFTKSTSEISLYDEYGGYTGGEKYEATGFFYTKKIGDRWWTIDPLGYPFYRVSVVQVAYGSSPNQKALTLAKYGTQSAWAEAASERLFELGFNSVGGWSDIATLSKASTPLSQTQIFNVATSYGNSIGVKVSSGGTRLADSDVIPAFDPDFAEYADTYIKGKVLPYVNDSSVYGWMSDNELADNLTMLDHALKLDYTDVRRVYTYATAWTFMYMKTGKQYVSMQDVTDELRNEFLAMTYDKYFEVVTSVLDKYDSNHMYMGCRFVNNNYKRESVMRVAGYWCDVVTFNYYSAWEGDPVLLQNIQNWLGDTPFVVTEWYAKGMDVWEENPLIVNKTGAGWTVRTQDDRGKFYQNYALMLIECKGCVGYDWFKYWDNDPSDANADASNRDSNKGIYSNSGNEYTALTDYMKELNQQKYTLIKFFDAR